MDASTGNINRIYHFRNPRNTAASSRVMRTPCRARAAAIPSRAAPRTIGCGEAVEQIGHRVVCAVLCHQVLARKRGALIALAACDKDDLALFVGKPVVHLLDG